MSLIKKIAITIPFVLGLLVLTTYIFLRIFLTVDYQVLLAADSRFLPNMSREILFIYAKHSVHSNSRADYGHTPITLAVSACGAKKTLPEDADCKNLFRLIKIYIDKGVDLHATREGYTPLHDAISLAEKRTVRALLDLGSDPAAKIYRPNRETHDMNSVELARFLAKSKSSFLKPRSKTYTEIANMLEKNKVINDRQSLKNVK